MKSAVLATENTKASKVRLGDYVKIRTGKLDANAAVPNGEYCFFTCSRDTLKIDSYSYDCECVLVAGNGELNVKYYSGKFDAYQRTYIIESVDKDVVDVRYMYWFLEQYVGILRSSSIGGVIKYIKLGNLTEAPIPLPPFAEQKRIAAELDLITEMIRNREAQLARLDTLVKAKFDEMFGNVENNTNKFRLVNLEEVCESMSAGKDVPNDSVKIKDAGHQVPIFSNGIENEGLYGYAAEPRIFKPSITISGRGTIGFVARREEPFVPIIRLIVATPNTALVDIVYMQYALAGRCAINTGCTIPQLTIPQAKIIKLALPPLALQKEFAAVVEEVDKSKAAIKKTIENLKTLYKARLQEYFA